MVHDIQPPRTFAKVGSPRATGGADGSAPGATFVTSAAVTTLTAVDDLVTAGDGIGLGVERTEFALDGAILQTGNIIIIAGADGRHEIRYRSVDVVGNAEDTRILTLYLDNTAPIINVAVGTPKAFRNNVTYVGPTTPITASAVDAGAGIATFITPTFPLPTGPNTLRYTATDLLGNASESVVQVTMDRTAPTVSIQSPTNARLYAAGTGSIPINYTITDDNDPTPTSTAFLTKVGDSNSVAVQNGTQVEPGVLTPGFWRLAVNAQDFVENVSQTSGQVFEILAHPVVFHVNDGSRTGDIFTSTVGDDANSGLSSASPKRNVTTVASIAYPGDTILIDAGTYSGYVRINKDRIFMTGADSTRTVISGGMSIENVIYVTIQNLQQRGSYIGMEFLNSQYCRLLSVTSTANSWHGVKFNSNSNYNTIRNCLFTANGQYGLDLWGASYNTIERNSSVSNQQGFFVERYCYGNVFSENRSSFNFSHGFALDNAIENAFRNNFVEGNHEFGTTVASGSASNTYRQNTFKFNKTGSAYIANSAWNTLITKSNLLIAPTGNGASIENSTPNTHTLIRNWWGTWDASEIRAHFRGFNPNGIQFTPFRLGEVNLDPAADTVSPAPPRSVAANLLVPGLEISWQPPLTSDEPEPNLQVAEYSVYYTTPVAPQRILHLADLPGSSTTFVDTGYHPLTRGFYLVTASDQAPISNESFFSDSVSIIPDLLPPRSRLIIGTPRALGRTDGSSPGDTFVTAVTSMTIQVEDDRTVVGDSTGYGGVQTFVTIDSGTESLYAGAFTLVALPDGIHTLRYRSVDRFGTAEVVRTGVLRVDNTPPVTTTSIGVPKHTDTRGTFIAASTPITFTDDDSGVGLAGDSVTTLTIATEGPQIVSHRATDLLGNRSETTNVAVIVDATPPSITSSSPESGRIYIARRDSLVIAFTISDSWDYTPAFIAELVDVEEGTRRPVTDGDRIEPLNIDDGFWRLEISATDHVGNASNFVSGTFQIIHDIQPPRTTAMIGSPRYEQGAHVYITSATPITLSAVDDLVTAGDGGGLGVAGIEYEIDSDGMAPYSTPILVPSEGRRTIRYRAIDILGNEELFQTLTVRVDNSAPATMLSIDISDSTGVTVIPQSLFTLDAVDAPAGSASGVAMTWFQVDGELAQVYSAPFTPAALGLAEGTHAISYWSADNLSHSEAPRTFAFRVSPALSLNAWLATGEARALVWLNGIHGGDTIPASGADIILEAIRKTTGVFSVASVSSRSEFIDGVRSGRYNFFMNVGDREGLNRQEEEELRERVRLGAGLISSTFDQVRLSGNAASPPHGLDNIFGVKLAGKFDDDLLIAFADTSFAAGARLQSIGRVEKIKEQVSRIQAWASDGDETHAAALANGFGAGRTIFMAFDLGQTATEGDSAKITEIIQGAVTHVLPSAREILPGEASPIRVIVRTLVADREVEVLIDIGPDLTLVDSGGGDTEQGGRIVIFRDLVRVDEEQSIAVVVTAPTPGADTYDVDIEARYLVRGLYYLGAETTIEVLVTASVSDILEQGIDGLLDLEGRVSSQDAHKLKPRRQALEGLRTLNISSASAVKNAIDDFLKAIEKVATVTDVGAENELLEKLARGVAAYGVILSGLE